MLDQQIAPRRVSGHSDAAAARDARLARSELTARDLLTGGVITFMFMSANIYMGLKTGMTVSSSILAAIISMAVLRLLGTGNVLETTWCRSGPPPRACSAPSFWCFLAWP